MPSEMPERALVVATVAASTNMTEFLTKMGEPLDQLTRKRWRDRLKRWQVDTSHWRHSHRRLYSPEDLVRAVAESTSIAGVMRKLGIPLAGGLAGLYRPENQGEWA